MRILMVDDDELDRLAIARALRGASVPIELIQAITAEEGIKRAEAEQFDAILLDYLLPDQNGIDVLRHLRARNDSTAIIVLSRMEEDLIAENCIEAGAQDFLLKDEVSFRRLTRAINLAKQRYVLEEQLKASLARLSKLAEKDTLTGLPNRHSFDLALRSAVARSNRNQERFAVVMLDLDNFKTVNDTLGHEAGDVLLIEVARRLTGAVRDSDLLARLGGDEFIVLAMGLKRDEQASLLAERIIASLQNPIATGGTELVMTTSIGIAVFGDYADNANDLVKCADIAMYRAKGAGRNQIRFYSEKLHQSVLTRGNLENDLRQALSNDQFRVYYQGQFRAVDGTLGGLEALLRWQHPKRGLLLPGEFLSIAEQMGLIDSIGEWVMLAACKQLGEWRKRYAREKLHTSVAVNLSAIQLQGKSLCDMVARGLSESGLPPECLELEISENALMEEPDKMTAVFFQLEKMGITLSVGGFGTGFSSLQHLKIFPIKILKLGRGFISDIGKNEKNERLLTAMIRFGQGLDLKITAEGVETKEQADFCRLQGCTMLQGYYFTHPLTAGQFEERFLT